jgi:hypothetical protein
VYNKYAVRSGFDRTQVPKAKVSDRMIAADCVSLLRELYPTIATSDMYQKRRPFFDLFFSPPYDAVVSDAFGCLKG